VESPHACSPGPRVRRIRSHEFKTIVGDFTYGQDDKWLKRQVLEVQFQNITGIDLDQFNDTEPRRSSNPWNTAPTRSSRRMPAARNRDGLLCRAECCFGRLCAHIDGWSPRS